MSIKPIETFYNGYRFRSRLEALWAVFFDAVGLQYEYEKEGFEFDSERYPVGFWMPLLSNTVEKINRQSDEDSIDWEMNALIEEYGGCGPGSNGGISRRTNLAGDAVLRQ